jgi:hypothetical protein
MSSVPTTAHLQGHALWSIPYVSSQPKHDESTMLHTAPPAESRGFSSGQSRHISLRLAKAIILQVILHRDIFFHTPGSPREAGFATGRAALTFMTEPRYIVDAVV